MDHLVDNDTKDFCWHLSKSKTQGLLEALFPNSVLFMSSHQITMSDVLNVLQNKKLYGMTKGVEEHWVGLLKSKGKNMTMAEESMVMFLNSILEAVKNITRERTNRSSHSFSYYSSTYGWHDHHRKWHARGAKKIFTGSYLQWKPDLVLSPNGAGSDWRDVLVFGEMKSRNNSDTQRASYTEVSGKTSVLLYTQDGRHAAPSLWILGSHIGLSFFNWGGPLKTHCIDIHTNPEIFLHIIVSLTTASFFQLGFNVLLLNDSGDKCVMIAWKGGLETKEVTIENLLFISDIMHGCGTTVWGCSMDFKSNNPDSTSDSESVALRWPHMQRSVVIKDSWIDPLWKYTEESILALLNATGVIGIPMLVHKEQVQGPHPTRPNALINKSTHLLQSILSEASYSADHRQYQLQVLLWLITKPIGFEILGFNSLAELLIMFIDYVMGMSNSLITIP